jgi:hypothetical protein
MIGNSAPVECDHGLVPRQKLGASGGQRPEGGRLLMPPQLETYVSEAHQNAGPRSQPGLGEDQERQWRWSCGRWLSEAAELGPARRAVA